MGRARTTPEACRTRRTVRVRALLAVTLVITGLAAAPGPIGGPFGTPSATAAGAFPTVDGLFEGEGSIGPGETYDFYVSGRGGLPGKGIDAVALNIAVTNATASTYLTVFPRGADRPVAANMNVAAGQTVSNMVIAKTGTNGTWISIYNYAGTVDVIVDVLGWYPTGGQYTGLTPARLADTRPGYPTIDGQHAGSGPIGPGATLDVTVTGRGNVPTTGVGAVVLNVAATGAAAGTYLTAYPTGDPRPVAANMNAAPGQTVSNMVIAKVGSNGKVSIYNYSGTVDVVVDVLGWFPTGGQFTGLVPARLTDTRPGYPTIDGQQAGSGPIGPGATLDVTVTGRGDVPATGVGAVALNVAATNPTAGSFLTAHPSGETRPLAANMNLAPGQTVSNMVIAKVGSNGKVSIFNYGGTVDVIVDVLGWFPTGGQYTGITPARLVDTRSAARGGPLRFDLSGAVGLTGKSPYSIGGKGTNLYVVTATGEREASVSGTAMVESFQILDGRVFVAFVDPVSLDETSVPGTCILAEIDRASGVPHCIDATNDVISSRNSYQYDLVNDTAFIQSDAAGNLYYAPSTGALKVAIVRRTGDGANPVAIMNDRYSLQDVQVMPDGTVFAAVMNLDTDLTYLRRIAPNGSVKDVPLQFQPSFIEPTADGNLLVGVYDGGQWRVKRWLTAADAFDATDWMTSTGSGAAHAANALCAGPQDDPFCSSSGAVVLRFAHTDDGSLFGLLTDDPDHGRVVRYSPGLAAVSTQIEEVLGIAAVPGGLVLTGYPHGESVQIMTFYDPRTGSERLLIPVSEKLIFDGVGWDSVGGRIAFRAYRGYEPNGGWKVGSANPAGGFTTTTVDDHDTSGLMTF